MARVLAAQAQEGLVGARLGIVRTGAVPCTHQGAPNAVAVRPFMPGRGGVATRRAVAA